MVPEMENSRRSFDRARDPSLIKKPRLTEDTVRPLHPPGRPFPNQRQVASSSAPASRVRIGMREAEMNDPSREAYQPQPVNPHHELVNQYKAALSELTFNSKPIITNLTIIAGENLHAAKAVATTICTNILEVPCEQKLPSLYLLDSIVKNIGRDYIKFFAARLPEVFCKAYRQVDPSTHASMRHLFGTWKGVFPPQTLQVIERELGFTSKTDGSSSGITPRVDPRTQRPPHSIHVNPKYLEQQRLQQPLRGKGMIDDVSGVITGSTCDVEKPERSNLPTGRAWISPSVKLNSIQHSQRDTLDPLHEKNIGEAYKEYEFGLDSQHSGFGSRKGAGRIADQGRDKVSIGIGGTFSDLAVSRDGSNTKRRISSFPTTNIHVGSGKRDTNRISGGVSSSWKNSEEEEYIWEMHSRLSESDIANLSSSTKQEPWVPIDPENLDSGSSQLTPAILRDSVSSFDPEAPTDSLEGEHRNHVLYGRLMPSQPVVGGHFRSGSSVSNSVPSQGHSAVMGRYPPVNVVTDVSRKGIHPRIGSTSTIGQRYQSMSRESSMQQRLSSPSPAKHPSRQLQNLREQDYEDHLSTHDFPESHLSEKSEDLRSEDSSPTLPLDPQFTDLHTFDAEELGAGTPTSGLSNSLAADISEHSSTGSLLAAVMKSDFLNNIIGAGIDCRSSENKEKQTLESGAPMDAVPATSMGLSSQDSMLAKQKIAKLPLPSVSLSSSHTAATSREMDSKDSVSDPISNLLNSLVSKGLISASKSDSLPAMPQQKSACLPESSTAVPHQKSLPATQQQRSLPTAPKQKSPPVAVKQKSLPVAVKQKSLPAVPRKPPPVEPEQKSPPALVQQKSLSAGPRWKTPPAVPLQKSTPAAPQLKLQTPVLQSMSASVVPKGDSALAVQGLPVHMPPQKSTAVPAEFVSLQYKSCTPNDLNDEAVASVATSSCILPVCTTEKVSPTMTAKESIPTQPSSMEIEDLIGFQFKPDIIRKFHSRVISSLFEDLPQECNVCGLHLRYAEQLDRHLDCHAKDGLKSDRPHKESRGWFMASCDWVSGKPVLQISGSIDAARDHGSMADSGPMVLADEEQYACILCGELFEDFYCQERGKWMFKGAVYMPVPKEDTDLTDVDGGSAGLIVHECCMSESCMDELGCNGGMKQDVGA